MKRATLSALAPRRFIASLQRCGNCAEPHRPELRDLPDVDTLSGYARGDAELPAKEAVFMSSRPVVRRRQLLAGLAAGAVIAFDPIRRSWIPAAQAQERGIRIPRLDGELVVDAAALSEAADDFGHIVHRTPIAVLRPGSVADVQRLVRFANQHDLGVSVRGQGHSTHGQAQVHAGVVVDSRTLNRIEHVGPEGAVVGPGVRWIDVLQAALAQGLTPPVLTDFIELSVGGTLSVGGIGGATNRYGLQVDNVLELQVVTGTGELRACSPSLRPELFNAVLGGLGQFALIVSATLKLIAAPSQARVYRLFYSELEVFTRDQRLAAADERFDYLQGQVLLAPEGGVQFMLEAAAYYTPPAQPNDASLLAGLTPLPGLTVLEEHTYFDWQNRLAPAVEGLRAGGQWALPHPFIDLFLPASAADSYIGRVLEDLTVEDTGFGPVLCYPFKRARSTRPFVVLPRAQTVFLFSILRFSPADPLVVNAHVADNRTLFERARDRGAKKYPIGSIPFTQADWVEHFGAAFAPFVARKAQFDPRAVLTRGQGIFGAR